MTRSDFQTAVAIVRERGLARLTKLAAIKVYDACSEWRLGVATSRCEEISEYGVRNRSCHNYWPSRYWDIRHAMKHLDLVPDKDVFLDLGSGKGRTVIIAATYPFRKVIGLEICSELNGIASRNLEQAKTRMRCKDVHFVTCDASAYQIPADVTVAFLFNPFRGAILRQVLENIRDSYLLAPRGLRVVYLNITSVEQDIAACDWLVARHCFEGQYRNAVYDVVA